MKNIIRLFLITILLFPVAVKAAPTGNLSCSSSGSVTVGNTITVSVRGSSSDAMWDTVMSYDSSKLQKVGGSDEHSIGNDFTTGTSYTYTFKAINEGSAWVKVNSAIADYEGNKAYPSTSCNISVSNPSSSSSSSSSSYSVSSKGDSTPKNSDNNLKSLGIEGKELTPKFNKDTLEYNIELDTDTTKINITAEKSDSKASITGDGEKDVVEGVNKFEIVVTAENGASKTYVINVNVKDKNPIYVTIKGKKYTVIKKSGVLDIPEGYEEKEIKIEGKEVKAYKNAKTKLLLVGLTSEKGKSALYIYNKNKNTYTKYIETKSNDLKLLILNSKLKKAPIGYKASTFKINNEKVEGYSNNTDFKLVYALNLDTNKKTLYVYDEKEKTFQRYNKNYNNVSGNINDFDDMKIIIICMSLALLIFIIILISTMKKNVKLKKEYISKVNPTIKNNDAVEYKNIKDDTIKLSKKELKEEKRRLKEERKTFLDD